MQKASSSSAATATRPEADDPTSSRLCQTETVHFTVRLLMASRGDKCLPLKSYTTKTASSRALRQSEAALTESRAKFPRWFSSSRAENVCLWEDMVLPREMEFLQNWARRAWNFQKTVSIAPGASESTSLPTATNLERRGIVAFLLPSLGEARAPTSHYHGKTTMQASGSRQTTNDESVLDEESGSEDFQYHDADEPNDGEPDGDALDDDE